MTASRGKSRAESGSNPAVLHLIPCDGIGGVEAAARSLRSGRHQDLTFERWFLVGGIEGADAGRDRESRSQGSLNDPRRFVRGIGDLLRRSPDLVIASLWRSVLVLLGYKVFRPRARTVVFLHLAHDVHFVDWLANRLGMMVTTEIWTDSRATLEQRIPRRWQGKARVISFLLRHAPMPEPRSPEPNFVFWGRLNRQKGLERALRVFARIAARNPAATLRMIGPDGGMEAELRALVSTLGLESKVSLPGPMDQDAIAEEATEASFYLQTSRDEGMALSVVEAMQYGLVPVVTPVGEIRRYCQAGENAVVVEDDDEAVEQVLALLDDAERYRRMALAAAEYWQGQSLYRDDVIQACRGLVGMEGSRARE